MLYGTHPEPQSPGVWEEGLQGVPSSPDNIMSFRMEGLMCTLWDDATSRKQSKTYKINKYHCYLQF